MRESELLRHRLQLAMAVRHTDGTDVVALDEKKLDCEPAIMREAFAVRDDRHAAVGRRRAGGAGARCRGPPPGTDGRILVRSALPGSTASECCVRSPGPLRESSDPRSRCKARCRCGRRFAEARAGSYRRAGTAWARFPGCRSAGSGSTLRALRSVATVRPLHRTSWHANSSRKKMRVMARARAYLRRCLVVLENRKQLSKRASPVSWRSMLRATSLPYDMAVTTLDAPLTKSPPAYTPLAAGRQRITIDRRACHSPWSRDPSCGEIAVCVLADRQYHAVAGDDPHFSGVDRPATARGVERAQPRLGDLDALDRAALADDAMRRGEEHETHAFFLGCIDLFRDGRHVLALASIDRRSPDAPLRTAVRAQSIAELPPPMMATRSPRSSAVPHASASRKCSAAVDAARSLPGRRDLHFLPGSERKEHRIELLFQSLQVHVRTDTRVAARTEHRVAG